MALKSREHRSPYGSVNKSLRNQETERRCHTFKTHNILIRVSSADQFWCSMREEIGDSFRERLIGHKNSGSVHLN